jgi:signal transduction histidine kinase
MSGLVPELYLSAAQSTQHCLAGGMDESVIYSFSIMGLNLGEQEQFELAFKYQDLAHEMCALYPNTFGATRGINGIVWCNMHSRSHPGEIAAYARRGIQSGKNCGDLYNAGLSYGPLMWNLQTQGKDLEEVYEVVQECLRFSKKNQLHFSVGLAEAVEAGWVLPMQQPSAALTPMEEKLKQWESRSHVASAGSYFVHLAMSHFYLGRYAEADAALRRVNDYLRGLTDNVQKRQWYVFQILTALRLHRHGGSASQWPKVLAHISPLLEKVEKWARLGPLLRPFVAAIHAEIAACASPYAEARSKYLDAIDLARTESYTFLEGFLNETLGELLLGAGQSTSDVYFREAVRLYRKCNAKGKELQVLERHPTYFASENQREAVADELPALMSEALVLPSLDVDYLMKTSLTMSGQIELESLLNHLIRIVLEASGGQHGYLITREGENWLALAEGHVGDKTVRTERRDIETLPTVANSLVNFVSRTHEVLVLANASEAGDFKHLPDVYSSGAKSVLCVPVLKQGTLIGVLYLENQLSPGMFTPDKVRMIELLTSFAANALDNARLVLELRRTTNELDQLNIDLEQRVKDRTAALEAANRELESFSYSVSHDLRAPLRAIQGFSKALLEQHKRSLNAEASDYLRRVLVAGDRMDALIDDLLKLSIVGRSEMRRVKVNLSKMAEEQFAQLRDSKPVEHATFVIEPSLSVEADEGLARILLENLLSNAWKFSSKQEAPHIEFTVANGAIDTFCVRDNGAGFDQNLASKIFRPFQRLHTQSEFPGTGIGLAIVQRIIQRHGGNVWAEAQPGHGAAFYFTLGPRSS